MRKRKEAPYNLKEAVYKRDDYTCFYCNYRAVPGSCEWKNMPIEIDHKIPLSKGGENVEDNLICACRRCNRRKHNKLNFKDE